MIARCPQCHSDLERLTKEERDALCELLLEVAEFGIGQYDTEEKNEEARHRVAKVLDGLIGGARG